mmetsp:Transcript_28210/g.73969  ORF Transcript_28210/g.73969 Transcript_28210/m.73969 type:complete len:302 (-) Transcript_28210:180-1085(-)
MEREKILVAGAAVAATAACYYFFVGRRTLEKLALFDAATFQRLLKTDTVGRNVQHFPVTTSTMTVAKELAAKGAAHGTAIVADEQTAGIGRRNRSWASKPGNLYFTLIWRSDGKRPEERITEMLQLNFACGVAVARAALSLGVDAKVKWPNDVWAGSCKLSGSLVDFDGKNTGYAGVGINVNQSMASLDADVGGANRATSLSVETGNHVSREQVLATVCNEIEMLMANDMVSTIAEYTALDMLVNQVVRVCHKSRDEADDKDYDAVVLGFYPNGNLKVSKVGDPDSEIALSGEEISIRPKQ